MNVLYYKNILNYVNKPFNTFFMEVKGMSTSRKQRNILVSALSILVITVPILAQSPETDQLLKSIPGDTLFCIRINNLNNSLSQMDQFLTNVSPVGVNMFIKAQLSDMLGSPQLAGLNIDGSFAAFGSVLKVMSALKVIMPVGVSLVRKQVYAL